MSKSCCVRVVVVIVVIALAAIVWHVFDMSMPTAEKVLRAASDLYERAEVASNVGDVAKQRRMLSEVNAKLDYVVRHLDDLASDADRSDAEFLRAKVVVSLNRTKEPDLWRTNNPYTVEVLYHARRVQWSVEEAVQGSWLDDAVIQSVSRTLPLPGGGGYLTVVDPVFREVVAEKYTDHYFRTPPFPTAEVKAFNMICAVSEDVVQVTVDELWGNVEDFHAQKGCEGANVSLLDVEW